MHPAADSRHRVGERAIERAALPGLDRSVSARIQGLAPPGYSLPPFQGWVGAFAEIQGLAPPGYSRSPFQGWLGVFADIQGLALPGIAATYFVGGHPATGWVWRGDPAAPFQGWPG